jgi:hypothetical protein
MILIYREKARELFYRAGKILCVGYTYCTGTGTGIQALLGKWSRLIEDRRGDEKIPIFC